MSHFLNAAYDLRYVIATALLIWAAAWVACKVLGWAAEEVARHAIDALADDAEWWSEPTRAEVEADMRDDAAGWERLLAAVEGIEPTPIYNATVRHIAHHAAASIEDEWAEMNGGAS